jgi:hypothetical protein
MIIYLANTAPGNEQKRPKGMLDIRKRLLSYHCIVKKILENHLIFKAIKNENQ